MPHGHKHHHDLNKVRPTLDLGRHSNAHTKRWGRNNHRCPPEPPSNEPALSPRRLHCFDTSGGLLLRRPRGMLGRGKTTSGEEEPSRRFYTQPHQCYSGLERPARPLDRCRVPQAGAMLVHRNLPAGPDPLRNAVAPDRSARVVGVEGLCTGSGLAGRQARPPGSAPAADASDAPMGGAVGPSPADQPPVVPARAGAEERRPSTPRGRGRAVC